MDKIRLYICNKCKTMSIANNICSKCLNSIDAIEVNSEEVEMRIIESSYSAINNTRFGLVEIRFNGMSEKIMKMLDTNP